MGSRTTERTETRHAATKQVSAALTRSAALQALALGFAYPSHAVLVQLKTRWNALLGSSRHWPADIRPPFLRAQKCLVSTDAGALEPEHVRLFGPSARCPLHETAYGDAGRLLGRSASLADIAGFYQAFGLHPATDNPNREDHIGLELEFMSLLALKEAYAMAEGWQEALEITANAQRRFVQDHLGTWTDALTAQVTRCAPHPFYAALTDSLRAFVRAETVRLHVSPIPVGGPVTDTLMGEDSLQCPYAPTSQEA